MNEEIIKLMTNISLLLQIKGESYFKFSAYSNAAEVIKRDNLDIKQLVTDGKISEIKGFGKALSEKITEFTLNGNLKYYDNLTKEVPEGLIDFLKVEGLGPKKVLQIYLETGISTLEMLSEACDNGRIESLKGFTVSSAGKIKNSTEQIINNADYKSRKIDFDQIQ